MLTLLTGVSQSGKTRWLESLLDCLEQRGVEVAGVLAPGVWREAPSGFEKLGIENLLLPDHVLIPFAQRADLAAVSAEGRAESQSEKAGLAWHIPDEAIARVNEHLRGLRALDARGTAEAMLHANGAAVLRVPVSADETAANRRLPRGLLLIDELGPLELLRGQGLTEAMGLLLQGPSERFPHAVVVVREKLLSAAQGCFDAAWGGQVEIEAPGPALRAKMLARYGLRE